MTDHPTGGTIDWEARENHPLMRQPVKCKECGHNHMPQEACPFPVNCYVCGAPTGLYDWHDGNNLRECHSCFRERVDG